MKAAKAAGAMTSFDLNFREKLWKIFGGNEHAVEVIARIVEHVDVLVGNEEDLQKGLGIPGPEVHAKSKLDPSAFFGMIDNVVKKHPQVKSRGDDAARSALDQPAQLERGGVDRRQDLPGADDGTGRARSRRRRRWLRGGLLLRPAERRIAGRSGEAGLGAWRAADHVPRRHDDGDARSGEEHRQGRLGAYSALADSTNLPSPEGEEYLRWYFNSHVWVAATFLGVPCLKSVTDMWNYQEIIASLRPKLVVEFGVHQGGSSLFFATIAGLAEPHSQVLSVDVDLSLVHQDVRQHPRIRLLESSSTDPQVAAAIREARRALPGPLFVVLDSYHTKTHVLAELDLLRPLTLPGDYVVVEDGIVNGHPVLPDFGAGPWEALEEYTARYPDDYTLDSERENKFGFTFAPRGFLIRR